MRVGKEDLPVIFSIVLAGIVSILDLANTYKISAIILVLLLGWFGRKKIKENEMKKNLRQNKKKVKEIVKKQIKYEKFKLV